MNTKRNIGFTIIEVMLFLAISSALLIALLVGMQASIERQRYYDSLVSLKAYLQMQYAYATNVVNDRPANENNKPVSVACNSNAQLSISSLQSTPNLGMSDCVIMGRYIYSNSNATEIMSSHVIGARDMTKDPAPSDIEELSNFRYSVFTASTNSDIEAYYQPDKYSLSANLQMKTTGADKQPKPFEMLIIRSPITGMVMTFVKPGNPDGNIVSLIKNGKNDQPSVFCIMPLGFSLTPGQRMAIRVNAFATSQSGVEIPKETDNICQ